MKPLNDRFQSFFVEHLIVMAPAMDTESVQLVVGSHSKIIQDLKQHCDQSALGAFGRWHESDEDNEDGVCLDFSEIVFRQSQRCRLQAQQMQTPMKKGAARVYSSIMEFDMATAMRP